MALSLSTAQAIVACNAVVDEMDADSPTPGYFRLYNNTPPDNAQASLNQYATNTLICTITCGDPAYGGAASGGSGAQAQIVGTPSGNAVATTDGNPISFYRAFRGNGTVLRQGLCSLTGAGGQFQISTLTVTAVGQTITVNTATFEQPTE